MPNCKVGDMAFVVKVKGEDYGRIVTIIKEADVDELKKNFLRLPDIHGKIWKINNPVTWHRFMSDGSKLLFKVPFCPDFNLYPIRGNLLEDQTEIKKELENPVTTQGEYLECTI